MRKGALRLALAAVCMGALTGVANATYSGLVWIPSTDLQAAKTGHFGIDTYSPEKGKTLTDYGLTFGGTRLEYGIDVLSVDGIKDPVRLNAKYLVKAEAGKAPAFAVGAYDYGSGIASNVYYAVASKSLPFARLTLGCATGKSSILGDDNNMLLAGVDKTVGKWWGAVDYQSGKSAWGALSTGVGYTLTKSTSAIVGYNWYNDKSLSNTFTFQLDVNF